MTNLKCNRTGETKEYTEAKNEWLIASGYKEKNNGLMIIDSKPTLYAIKKAMTKFENHNVKSFALFTGDGRHINTTQSIYTALKWNRKNAQDNYTSQYSQMGNNGRIEVELYSGKKFSFYL